MGNASWLTKLDINAAFHKIRIKPGEEWKTAFRTRYVCMGLVEWNVISPLGLQGRPLPSNAVSTLHSKSFWMTLSLPISMISFIYSNGSRQDHRRKVKKVRSKKRVFNVISTSQNLSKIRLNTSGSSSVRLRACTSTRRWKLSVHGRHRRLFPCY